MRGGPPCRWKRPAMSADPLGPMAIREELAAALRAGAPDAVERLRQALAAGRDRPGGHARRGWVSEDVREVGPALAEYQLALQDAPDDVGERVKALADRFSASARAPSQPGGAAGADRHATAAGEPRTSTPRSPGEKLPTKSTNGPAARSAGVPAGVAGACPTTGRRPGPQRAPSAPHSPKQGGPAYTWLPRLSSTPPPNDVQTQGNPKRPVARCLPSPTTSLVHYVATPRPQRPDMTHLLPATDPIPETQILPQGLIEYPLAMVGESSLVTIPVCPGGLVPSIAARFDYQPPYLDAGAL